MKLPLCWHRTTALHYSNGLSPAAIDMFRAPLTCWKTAHPAPWSKCGKNGQMSTYLTQAIGSCTRIEIHPFFTQWQISQNILGHILYSLNCTLLPQTGVALTAWPQTHEKCHFVTSVLQGSICYLGWTWVKDEKFSQGSMIHVFMHKCIAATVASHKLLNYCNILIKMLCATALYKSFIVSFVTPTFFNCCKK